MGGRGLWIIGAAPGEEATRSCAGRVRQRRRPPALDRDPGRSRPADRRPAALHGLPAALHTHTPSSRTQTALAQAGCETTRSAMGGCGIISVLPPPPPPLFVQFAGTAPPSANLRGRAKAILVCAWRVYRRPCSSPYPALAAVRADRWERDGCWVLYGVRVREHRLVTWRRAMPAETPAQQTSRLARRRPANAACRRRRWRCLSSLDWTCREPPAALPAQNY